MEGTAEVQLGKERAVLTANQSVLIPAGTEHGFRNPDRTILHVRATLAAPIFEATYDKNELSRRWVPNSQVCKTADLMRRCHRMRGGNGVGWV